MDNVLIAALGLAGVAATMAVAMFQRYRKVGPNEALIISGRGEQPRIVSGGGTFVVPIVEKADVLSLEVLTIDVHTPDVYTAQGVTVEVDGVAQLKVDTTSPT